MHSSLSYPTDSIQVSFLTAATVGKNLRKEKDQPSSSGSDILFLALTRVRGSNVATAVVLPISSSNGRLNHNLASRSYQFVDSQQGSLVLGSHGVQIGRNKAYKTNREDPLKKGLLAAWENEA